MAKAELTLRAGSTGGVQFRLMTGIAGYDLTGYGTVELWRRDRAGGTSAALSYGAGAGLTVNGTAGGSVFWTPGTADLAAGSSPYECYFRAYNGTSWVYFPEDSEFTVHVRERW